MPQEPRQSAPDEIFLTGHPVPGGWLWFVADGDRPVTASFATAPLAAAAQELVTAWAPRLRATKRLLLADHDAMAAVSFESLLFDGATLGQRLEVVHVLDLPGVRAREHAPPPPRNALLAVNPRRDLRQRRITAAHQIGDLLREAGWSVRLHERDEDAATGDAPPSLDELLHHLTWASLFLYVGHAEATGPGTLPPTLFTANSTGILAGDVITLDPPPSWVILGACESALGEAAPGGAQGLGLAQAFIVRGSRWVIATTRKVPTELTTLLVAELLRRWLGSPGADEPARLLEAARAAVRAGLAGGRRPEREEWSRALDAFRLYVP